MSTPLGDFIRAKRDAIRPESLGLPTGSRRRAPGLRRSELAVRAGISVEYLTRIEQGQDRNPSSAVVRMLAEALQLNASEHAHLRYLTKISGGECLGVPRTPPARDVRAPVRAVLDQLEPGVAVVANRLGDILAYTQAFGELAKRAGLLDTDAPNLTRFVFTDDRARSVFPEWDRVADEQAFHLWLGPSVHAAQELVAELTATVGEPFTSRYASGQVHQPDTLRWNDPGHGERRFHREFLELPVSDAQQLVVFLEDAD